MAKIVEIRFSGLPDERDLDIARELVRENSDPRVVKIATLLIDLVKALNNPRVDNR